MQSDKLADQLSAYLEACNSLRHYSNASLAVRLASVAQGIGILGVWAISLMHERSRLIVIFPIAGLLVTFLLYGFHYAYFRASEFFYGAAADMEKKLFEEGFRPMHGYGVTRQELYRNKLKKAVTVNAAFTLICVLFLLALLATCYILFTARKVA